jgi:hypothetical protein
MRSSRVVATIAAAGIWVGTGCGGGDGMTDPDDPGGSNNGASPMTATIDGQAWKASSTTGLATALQFSRVSGGYILTGADQTATGAAGTSLVFTINNIAAPGTYPLGTDAISVFGGFAGVVVGNGGTWTTPLSGAAGTITITTLTTTRIAGTFTFTATASAGSASGTNTVTNGIFDLPIANQAVVATLPDSVGSKMSLSLNGTAWNAAIIAAGSSLGFISITGINSMQTLVFTLPLPAGPGTYQLNNAPGLLQAWDPNSVKPAGARCCWGIASDIGSITFTSLTKTRAKGTLTATLRPQPGTAASGNLVITNATFDVGLFHNP